MLVGSSHDLCRGPNQLDGQDRPAIADWSRERPLRFWDPGRKLLLTVRRYQYWQRRGGPFATICCKVLVLRHRFWSVVTGADIPLNSHIGGGLLIPHPNGIVIHPDAQIGVNCLLFQQVTIGSIEGGSAVPTISDHVDVGAGAKILGPVSIHSHARIGANAVITKDVEAGSTAFGFNQSKRPEGERQP
ncbi:serine acetyltransferase [Bradyrhizobium sp. STM 3809]|uniref:serine acetyltransferase n=1 Tax=Bradyrhizobium sp. STM 3809 TaxID=551936 RepID=UPI000A00A496